MRYQMPSALTIVFEGLSWCASNPIRMSSIALLATRQRKCIVCGVSLILAVFFSWCV